MAQRADAVALAKGLNFNDRLFHFSDYVGKTIFHAPEEDEGNQQNKNGQGS